MNHIWNEKQTRLNVGTYEATLTIKSNIGLHYEAFNGKLATFP